MYVYVYVCVYIYICMSVTYINIYICIFTSNQRLLFIVWLWRVSCFLPQLDLPSTFLFPLHVTPVSPRFI